MLAFYFASAYGSDTYNSSVYGSASTSTSTGTTTSSNGGTTLANTGFDLLLAATLASVIVFAALVIRFFRKPAGERLPENTD